jgi:hypothetical protein
MGRNLWAFLGDAGGWGMTSLFASLASFVAAIYEHYSGKSVPAFWLFVISFVLFVIGGYKAWDTKREELEAEIIKRSRPEVVAICDWKRNQNEALESNAKSLILKTLTDIPALDVKVQDIEQELGTASFRMVGLLDGKSTTKPYCSIEKKTQYAHWDLFSLFRDSCKAMNVRMGEAQIPITIDYRDKHGGQHQSLNVLRYDSALGTGEIHHVRFVRKTQAAS